MPVERHALDFVPVAAEHYGLIETWLKAPHMREWWGEPEEELGHIRAMVEGRDTTRPFLIVLSGKPVGYIQYWFLAHWQNAEWITAYPWLRELPSDAVGIDLSIGEAALLSRGIGSAAARALASRLYAEGYRTLIIDPDIANLRAIRAYEKAGFRPVAALEGRTGDTLIMQFHPEANSAR
jgi:aminoglycoside 6'-N-acetyltransferase